MPLTFVYRTHYEGLLGRRIVRLPDASVLAWFVRVWPQAMAASEPHDVVAAELGERVYGLSTFFILCKEKSVGVPDSETALAALLERHRFYEQSMFYEAGVLRVLTDDDDVDLAYFFFDEAAAEPERVSYLLRTEFPLPTAARSGDFRAATRVEPLEARGSGEGRTYLVFLTYYDSSSLDLAPVRCVEGVRVPELVNFLRENEPPGLPADAEFPPTWPLELRLLRALIAPGDTDLAPAIARAASYPLHGLGPGYSGRAGLGRQEFALESFEKLRATARESEVPCPAVVDVSAHILQVATEQTDIGYQQWFIFDDVWAGANVELASSLLRFAAHWDPWHE